MDKRNNLFIIVASCITFFLGFESGGFQLVLLQVSRYYNLNNVEMGALVTAQLSAITVGPLVFGWLADRIGKKIILMISMPFFAVGCIGAAFSTSALIFAVFIFVTGIGYGASECIGSSAISDSFPGQESKYLNIMQCAFCLGAVLSPQIFSRLISAGLVTWRMVFLIAGFGFVFIFPLLCLTGTKQSGDSAKRPNPPQAENGETPGTAKTALKILSPLLIILFIAMLCNVAIEVGIAFFADTLFVTEYSNTILGAYAISGFWLAMTVSRIIFAFTKIKMRDMILIGFSSSCLLMIALLLNRNQWFLLGIFILLGAAMAPIWPMILGMGTSSYRERSGTVASILYAAGSLGGTAMPVLIGWTSERAGFYGGFGLLAVASAIGFLIMWLGGKQFKEQKPV